MLLLSASKQVCSGHVGDEAQVGEGQLILRVTDSSISEVQILFHIFCPTAALQENPGELSKAAGTHPGIQHCPQATGVG